MSSSSPGNDRYEASSAVKVHTKAKKKKHKHKKHTQKKKHKTKKRKKKKKKNSKKKSCHDGHTSDTHAPAAPKEYSERIQHRFLEVKIHNF